MASVHTKPPTSPKIDSNTKSHIDLVYVSHILKPITATDTLKTFSAIQLRFQKASRYYAVNFVIFAKKLDHRILSSI